MMKHQFRRFTPFQDNQDLQVHDLLTNKVADQDTVPLAALYGSPRATPYKVDGSLSTVVQSMISTGLVRLKNPQPEGLSTRGLKVVKPQATLGLLPILILINASGLLFISFSYYVSILRYGELAFEVFFFCGLLLMLVPNLLRLISSRSSQLERLCLLCVLGISLYLIQFMVSPLHFSSYDEFLHWRTADEILRTGHLFSENPMLTASPYYPGLEIVTHAISTTSGLSTFQSAILVISAARLLMILSLFLFYEQITGSSRMAGIATIIYMANPHFLLFDAIFNYETLALPLATFMLYILVHYKATNKNYRWVIFTAWIVLVAVTITHHMTDYVFIGMLILWAATSLFRDSSGNDRVRLAAIALFGIFLSLVYVFLLKGNPVIEYLSRYFAGAFADLGKIIAGASIPRPLFATNPNIPPTPIWDRLLMAGSVSFVMLGLPFGLLILWHHYRHNTLAITFGIFSFAYPISQVFRFTNFGAEITDRSAAFLFLPIAYLLTVLITHFWPTRTQKLSRKATSLIICSISVMFLGGVVLGGGPAWTNLPGPYEVTADVRSVEPEGIQDAIWSLTYLGPDNRIGTDRINRMLMLSYGHQRIVTGLKDKVDVAPVFYSSRLGPKEMAILRQARIRYLVVDLRLSTSLPLLGFYFEEGEVGSFRLTSPISRAVLAKFNTIPQIYRVFDSGNIVIYDVRAFVDRSGP